MRDSFHGLAVDLEARFAEGVDAPWTDFGDWALRAFQIQYEGNGPYHALCEARGVRPGVLADWRDAPLVPATAFKHLDLIVGDPSDAEVVFRTSGTTTDGRARGRHAVRRRSLYRASLLPPIAAHLTGPDRSHRMIGLVPPPGSAPSSSLSWMVDAAGESLCTDTRWAVDDEGAPDADALAVAVAETGRSAEPVVVAGTAFGFVHLLDGLGATGSRVALPEGSRVMETGGFKGRSRTVGRAELHRAIASAFDVPLHHVVNEYGMTELLSQLWEPTLHRGPAAAGIHVPPPWLAVRALDPVTLADLGEDREGLLAFFDLANLGSVSAVLTQDVGSVSPAGVRLAGRLSGAEPRGCSLALEELLDASGAGG